MKRKKSKRSYETFKEEKNFLRVSFSKFLCQNVCDYFQRIVRNACGFTLETAYIIRSIVFGSGSIVLRIFRVKRPFRKLYVMYWHSDVKKYVSF